MDLDAREALENEIEQLSDGFECAGIASILAIIADHEGTSCMEIASNSSLFADIVNATQSNPNPDALLRIAELLDTDPDA